VKTHWVLLTKFRAFDRAESRAWRDDDANFVKTTDPAPFTTLTGAPPVTSAAAPQRVA